MLAATLVDAFFHEMEKIAASAFRLQVGKSRLGKRPLSVSSLLKKEKDGSLYKNTKIAIAILPYIEPPRQAGSVIPPKKKGDVPTRDDSQAIKREDGRENATTVHSQSYFALANAGERRE